MNKRFLWITSKKRMNNMEKRVYIVGGEQNTFHHKVLTVIGVSDNGTPRL